jgi:hypothetical protein
MLMPAGRPTLVRVVLSPALAAQNHRLAGRRDSNVIADEGTLRWN